MRTETFRGPGSSLPPYQYVLIDREKSSVVIIGIIQTCTAYWNKPSGIAQESIRLVC